MINSSEIEDAINKLAYGKSCGIDGIYAGYLRLCSSSYNTQIIEYFISFLVHKKYLARLTIDITTDQ